MRGKKAETTQAKAMKKTQTAEKASRAEAVYRKRFEKHLDELRWLYMELYDNGSMFAELCDFLHRFYEERGKDLKKKDIEREKCQDWYKGNDMLGMMLYIDNFAGNLQGVKEKLPYIKSCNVNYIHLMPFLDTPKGRSDGGYAVADFRKVQPALGTMDDLESLTTACRKEGISVCMDFVMNHTSEDHEWAKRARAGEGEYMSRYFFFDNDAIPAEYEKTVPQVFPTTAPGNFTWLPDAGHFDIVNSLPKEYVFLNYLRCHDDIGWGLDYDTLRHWGFEERSHKQYLNNFFQGYEGESVSRGELYNADPVSGDARFCGTTASMCGIEKAGFEQDREAMARAVRLDVTLHAYMFMQSGIPVLYSGDEVGQVNDYSYKDDPDKAADSRYLHRGKMNWELAEQVSDQDSVSGQIFGQLDRLEAIRSNSRAFTVEADARTLDTGDDNVLGFGRVLGDEEILGIFNFSGYDKRISLKGVEEEYIDLITGEDVFPEDIPLPAYGFCYMGRLR